MLDVFLDAKIISLFMPLNSLNVTLVYTLALFSIRGSIYGN